MLLKTQISPGSLTFTSTDETFASRTETLFQPGGKKLLLTTTVILSSTLGDPKVSSIDLVKTLTFNQNATFTKGSTLQHYSVIGGADEI
ncbi:MAG: hypothetical protein CM15mV13_3260 [uncultured marine virus]|nr:MAG: hypothetical protein CM15mV13_3260 [uncultured marine virus]